MSKDGPYEVGSGSPEKGTVRGSVVPERVFSLVKFFSFILSLYALGRDVPLRLP